MKYFASVSEASGLELDKQLFQGQVQPREGRLQLDFISLFASYMVMDLSIYKKTEEISHKGHNQKTSVSKAYISYQTTNKNKNINQCMIQISLSRHHHQSIANVHKICILFFPSSYSVVSVSLTAFLADEGLKMFPLLSSGLIPGGLMCQNIHGKMSFVPISMFPCLFSQKQWPRKQKERESVRNRQI